MRTPDAVVEGLPVGYPGSDLACTSSLKPHRKKVKLVLVEPSVEQCFSVFIVAVWWIYAQIKILKTLE